MRQGGHGALLLLDLDDFKGVNDTYGHLVGDQLLEAVARRLEAVTRTTDTLCRSGAMSFSTSPKGSPDPMRPSSSPIAICAHSTNPSPLAD